MTVQVNPQSSGNPAQFSDAFSYAGYSSTATPITASSGNVANAAATATLAAAAGKTTYITGFQITSAGATAAAVVNYTITGLAGGTLTGTYVCNAGVTSANFPISVPFVPPVPAAAQNTAIVVTLPALGAGNTNATVSAQGIQI